MSSHNHLSTYSDSQILYQSIQVCLTKADAQGRGSIAFPAIGTGHLGFTKQEVASIMTKAVKDYAKMIPTKMEVHFVIYPPEHDTFTVTISPVLRLRV